MSSQCYLYNYAFHFIIGLTGIYIERYLGGGAEFKAAITVDFGSFSLIPPPPLSPSPPPCHHNSPETTRNHSATSPSPLLRDVGSTIDTPGCAKRTTDAPAPPSPKGCGRVRTYSTRELGRGKTRGTQGMGGPYSASQKRATTFVVARFSLITFSPNSQPTTNDIKPRRNPPPTPSLSRRPDDLKTQRQ